MAIFCPFHSVIGKEYNLAASSTRRSGKTAGQFLSTCQCLLVEYRVKEFVELVGLAAHNGGLLVNHTLTNEIHGNLDHCCTCAFTITSLEEPEFAFLYGELHILHIAIVLLKLGLDGIKLSVDFGHSFLHRGELSCALFFADTLEFCPTAATFKGNLLRRTNTSHNVFALCVDEPFAIEDVFASGGIAAEAYASGGGVAHVTEYHSHYGNSRTPLCGDAFHLAVEDGALVHPAVKHGADSAPELLHGIGGECLARLCEDGFLEEGYELLEVFHIKFVIQLHALFFLYLFNDSLEGVDVVLVGGLHTKHHVAIHLHETAISVVGEAGVVGLTSQTFYHLIVQTEVEDGIHHTRHRGARARAYGEEEGILHIAKLGIHKVFNVMESVLHICL